METLHNSQILQCFIYFTYVVNCAQVIIHHSCLIAKVAFLFIYPSHVIRMLRKQDTFLTLRIALPFL